MKLKSNIMARRKTYKLHEKVYCRTFKQKQLYLMYGEIVSIRNKGKEDEYYVIEDKDRYKYNVKYEDLYKNYDDMIDDERNYL